MTALFSIHYNHIESTLYRIQTARRISNYFQMASQIHFQRPRDRFDVSSTALYTYYIITYTLYRLIPDLNFRRWRRLFENYHQMTEISLLCIHYGYFFTVQYKRNERILLCYYNFNIIIYSNATAAIFLLILTSSEPLCRVVSTTCRKQMHICDVNRS